MSEAPSNPYFATVADQWDEIRGGYFTEHMRDAAINCPCRTRRSTVCLPICFCITRPIRPGRSKNWRAP